MDADGSNVTRVTASPANDWLPAWSADGMEILFAPNRGGRELDVYATSLDGTSVRRLTTASGHDYEAAWRPYHRVCPGCFQTAAPAVSAVNSPNG
jgi:Tol biopolymer transport system component